MATTVTISATDFVADRDQGDHHQRDDEELQQPEDDADAALADQVFAPGLLQQQRAFLDRIDRADVAADEDRHGHEGDHGPGGAEQAGDPFADDAGAFLDGAQDHAHGRGDQRIAEDRAALGPGDVEAVGDGGISAASGGSSPRRPKRC
jgi:hypothetical protein